MQQPLKALTLLLTAILLVTLVSARLATSTTTRSVSNGKQQIAHRQVIKATDVLTETFEASQAGELESNFDFGRFRLYFMAILAFLVTGYALLMGNKRLAGAISVTFAFGAAIVCTAHFDSFDNYYFGAMLARFEGQEKTIHTDFGWLSNPLFWALFGALLLLSWISVWMQYRNDRSAKRTGAELIDD
jgi:hypothetical protein